MILIEVVECLNTYISPLPTKKVDIDSKVISKTEAMHSTLSEETAINEPRMQNECLSEKFCVADVRKRLSDQMTLPKTFKRDPEDPSG